MLIVLTADSSELRVQAQAQHIHRTSVAVVTGIRDALVADRQRHVLRHAEAVEPFQDAFGAVVQLSVAEEKAESAAREVIAMRGR